jgi:bacillopeptidase F
MKKSSRIIFVSMVLTCLVCPSLQAGEIGPNLRASLQGLNPGDEIAVIITLTDQVDVKSFRGENKRQRRTALNRALRDQADRSQRGLWKFFRQKRARKIIPLWIFNGMAVTLRAATINELAARPEVQSIQLDGTVTLPVPSLAVESTPEWNLEAIKAPTLWTLGYTGTGVVVANMDTGVDADHPDLAAGYRGGSNSWYDPNGQHATPYDYLGHGTQTMGLMVGGNAGGTFIGVAPDARWIAVKLFDDAGNASYSAIHLGCQWLLDPDGDPATDDLPDVVNSSWGFEDNFGQCISEFQPDIQALKAAGIALVFSAGNQGPDSHTSVSPANYPESIAVGSVDEFLDIASSSSRGPSACDGSIYPELVAPGVSVRSSDLTYGGVFPNSYAVVSGTSFAAPHVSGAMALLLSVNPQLTVDELEMLLTQSATDLGIPGWDNDFGKGLLDVAAANNLLPITDTNLNGIEDGWELHFFGDLTTATAGSDFDRDYYTDLQEYLNWRNEELDPGGQPYDPTVENAAGGSGYEKPTILWLTLPAILNSAANPLP